MVSRPQVGLSVIIIKDNKVLLGKRKSTHGQGDWCFPGGHLEFGETWEDCAQRETLEETGLYIKNIRFGTATNDIFTAVGKHYITIIMLANYNGGEVQLLEPEKCERWEWFSRNNLPQPLFLPIQNLLKQNYCPLD